MTFRAPPCILGALTKSRKATTSYVITNANKLQRRRDYILQSLCLVVSFILFTSYHLRKSYERNNYIQLNNNKVIAVRPTCSGLRLCVGDPAPIFENVNLHPNGAVCEFILSLKPKAGIIT